MHYQMVYEKLWISYQSSIMLKLVVLGCTTFLKPYLSLKSLNCREPTTNHPKSTANGAGFNPSDSLPYYYPSAGQFVRSLPASGAIGLETSPHYPRREADRLVLENDKDCTPCSDRHLLLRLLQHPPLEYWKWNASNPWFYE